MILTVAPEAKVLSPPPQRRSALRDRRPHLVRRHTGLVAPRFAVPLAGDVLAIFLGRPIALTSLRKPRLALYPYLGTKPEAERVLV